MTHMVTCMHARIREIWRRGTACAYAPPRRGLEDEPDARRVHQLQLVRTPLVLPDRVGRLGRLRLECLAVLVGGAPRPADSPHQQLGFVRQQIARARRRWRRWRRLPVLGRLGRLGLLDLRRSTQKLEECARLTRGRAHAGALAPEARSACRARTAARVPAGEARAIATPRPPGSTRTASRPAPGLS